MSLAGRVAGRGRCVPDRRFRRPTAGRPQADRSPQAIARPQPIGRPETLSRS